MKHSAFVLAAALAGIAFAQDGIRIPFSDPSRPGRVVVHTLNGNIVVKAGPAGMVTVETKEMRHHRERSDGLHRIPMQPGMQAEESDNTVTVSSNPPGDTDLYVTVPPQNASLKVNSISGDITVDGVGGDIEVDATNGKAVLTNVSGSAVAHSLNGGVIATFVRVAPDKAMSFNSLNGDINVTLPPDTRARLKMKTDNGELYTDFDVKLEASAQKVIEENDHGRHKIKQDHTTYGTINGGGPEMQFTSFNGNIYIRKQK
jgi:Putative adhesin